tara:strand:- start:1367 stop:2800 length:1434 start_codon:yes stop_codon:yes gene_type:complete
MSRHTTPSNPITATQGRLNNSSTDQRRWSGSSNAIGRAQTRPSRSTPSRDTIGGTVFGGGTAAAFEAAIMAPFEPVIYKEGDSLLVRITPSHLIVDALVVDPTFEEQPLEDADDPEFVAPSKAVEDGDWHVWVQHTGTGAEVKVEQDVPEMEEGKKYYPVGEFVIEDGALKSKHIFTQTSLEVDMVSLPWVPRFFRNADDELKFTIGKGSVLDLMLGTYIEPELEDDYTPVTDDKYYVKVDTSANGTVTAIEVLTADDPANTQHSILDGTSGEYHYKLFEIKGTEADGFYADQALSSDIHFHTRDIDNVGDGSEWLKAFNSASNTVELKTFKIFDNEPIAGDDWVEADVDLVINENSEDLELQLTVLVPPVVDGNPKDFAFYDAAPTAFSQITNAAAFAGAGEFGDWALEFAVTDNLVTGFTGGTTSLDLWDATGSSQTVARIPLQKSGVPLSTGGSWMVIIACVNGGPVAQLRKIS